MKFIVEECIKDLDPKLPYGDAFEKLCNEREDELEKLVKTYKDAGMFAETDEEAKDKEYIFEFYGCFWHGHHCPTHGSPNQGAKHPLKKSTFAEKI